MTSVPYKRTCAVCGKHAPESHVCPPEWYAWADGVEDPGEDFQDARVVRAHTAEQAALKFAQMDCDSCNLNYDEYLDEGCDVAVRFKGGDTTHVIPVYAARSIEFYVRPS